MSFLSKTYRWLNEVHHACVKQFLSATFIYICGIYMKNTLYILFFCLLFGGFALQAQNKTYSALAPQCKIFAPNAFTPNDDGVNDFFYMGISGACEAEKFSLKIYDRWGRLVFEGNSITDQWDGNYDGQQLKEGVYLWQSSVTWTDESSAEKKFESKKGTLVLIR